jgi:hypothetical protein
MTSHATSPQNLLWITFNLKLSVRAAGPASRQDQRWYKKPRKTAGSLGVCISAPGSPGSWATKQVQRIRRKLGKIKGVSGSLGAGRSGRQLAKLSTGYPQIFLYKGSLGV